MPVTVQCFHCNAILDLDDGFRGGVCRCSNCGSLLQVPRGDDAPETPVKRVPPATPPSPKMPTGPIQNASSSKLDVGLSRGQFESPPSSQLRRQDLGLSSGVQQGRIHPTMPVAAPVKSKRPRKAEGETAAVPETMAAEVPVVAAKAPAASKPEKRGRGLMWLSVALVVASLLAMGIWFVYSMYFSEPANPW